MLAVMTACLWFFEVLLMESEGYYIITSICSIVRLDEVAQAARLNNRGEKLIYLPLTV